MSSEAMAASLFGVATAAALWFFIWVQLANRGKRAGTVEELRKLEDEAMVVAERLPSASASRKEELQEDIEVFAAPNCGMPDVLRAMIRFMPSHYDYDIAGAALVLRIGREHGTKLSLTADAFTASHIELHQILNDAFEDAEFDARMNGLSKRSLKKAWDESQKDICFAMEHLDEYPMILSIVRDRGVTDVHEALAIAKMMQSSDAPVLSSGML